MKYLKYSVSRHDNARLMLKHLFRNRPELNFRTITQSNIHRILLRAPSYTVNDSRSAFAMLSIELWYSELQF